MLGEGLTTWRGCIIDLTVLITIDKASTIKTEASTPSTFNKNFFFCVGSIVELALWLIQIRPHGVVGDCGRTLRLTDFIACEML